MIIATANDEDGDDDDVIVYKSFCFTVYSIKQKDSEVKDSDINNNKRSNTNESTISTVTTTTTKKMTTQQQSSPKKIDGVGPTTSEGMPLSLRSVN